MILNQNTDQKDITRIQDSLVVIKSIILQAL